MAEDAGRRSSWWRRLVPGIDAPLGHRRSWLRGDLLAGVTVAAYLVPQVMAYAGVAGLPPVAGLWAILPTGALHGFPVSSSASRTALAASTRARSQGYSLVAGAVVLAVLLFLSPLLSRTPSAVLGALVVYAAVRMIDLAGFRRLASFRRRELLLALGCLAGVLALGILYGGVIVAVGLSVAELLTRVARPHDAVEGLVPGLAGMHDIDDYPQARTIPGLLVYRYDSPLFFANAEDFRRRALAAVDEQTAPVHWFVLNTEANVEVDITALDAVTSCVANWPTGHRVRPGPGQAGSAGRLEGVRPGALRGHGPHLPHAAHRGGRLSRVERRAIGTGPGRATRSGTGHPLCHPTVRSGRISVPDLPWTIS
ncbi:SulP family inorganic anion transporter [Streptomyces puniciscabiei]